MIHPVCPGPVSSKGPSRSEGGELFLLRARALRKVSAEMPPTRCLSERSSIQRKDILTQETPWGEHGQVSQTRQPKRHKPRPDVQEGGISQSKDSGELT